MATLDATGNIQLEQGDVLPQKVAHRTDDPGHITQKIDELNATINNAEDLAKAVAFIDEMRRSWRSDQGLPPEESLAAPDEPVMTEDVNRMAAKQDTKKRDGKNPSTQPKR